MNSNIIAGKKGLARAKVSVPIKSCALGNFYKISCIIRRCIVCENSYFDVSVDELIGYVPMLGREQIRYQYQRLAKAFVSRPFAEVLGECEEQNERNPWKISVTKHGRKGVKTLFFFYGICDKHTDRRSVDDNYNCGASGYGKGIH